ncbi:MAG TPA: SDR family NAD(P)-dependent oxidoreductase [Acidimicrobiales bacterium]|jgi:NAD(P)-dependent dehydrogenase (short-subunit alcohol dehydrogenase family)|nr:SDR family NAD(P)-dependent oxidoreductase [Acidimicrobiales bacterium]
MPGDAQALDGNAAIGPRPLVPGRVALITGGAGAIGAASAIALAAHGADVVVADIDAARVAATVEQVEGHGAGALGVVADLTEDGAVEDAVARANDRFGRVDILVNALGHHLGLAAPFETTDEAGWDALYRVNLLHVLRASHAVIPGMKARSWGRIVNFSSVEGIRSMPNAAPYTAFKGAIDSFTKSLGVELARDGIRVNAIAVDKTRAHQVNFYDLGAEYDRQVPVWIPAGRYAEGADVAAVVLFLASDLSFWVVGQTIPADGGTLAAGGWYRTPVKWTNSPLLLQYFEDDPSINAARPRGVQ